MTKTMEKQVHFCSRHPGPCRINFPEICGNFAKKQAETRKNRTGNAPKQCGNLPKMVPEIKQNCARKAYKSVAKKLPNHVSNSPLWCRTSTGRPQLVRAAPLIIRVAPLPSPILSPIFLNYYFASIFRDVILKIPRSEQTSPRPLLTVF